MWLPVASAGEPQSPQFEPDRQDDMLWMKLEHSAPQTTSETCCVQRRPSLRSPPRQEKSSSEAMLVPRSERVRCLVDTFHSLGVAAFHPRQRPHDPKSLAGEWQLVHYLATTRMMQAGTQGGMALSSHGPLFDLLHGVGLRPLPMMGPSGAPPPHPQPKEREGEGDTRNHSSFLADRSMLEGHEEGKDEEPRRPPSPSSSSLLYADAAWVSSLTKAYPSARRRALLIVCDAFHALSLAERARGDGFGIEIARSALSGLALLAVQPFDLVVSELAFPMVDGLEMVQRLREFENDDEFLDRSSSENDNEDGEGKQHRRRVELEGGANGLRGAFTVLVRNGTPTYEGLEEEALEAGADLFVDTFEDVRFRNLQELLDEIQCDAEPVSLAVSTRDEPFPLPPSPPLSPLLTALPAPTPTAPLALPAPPLPLLIQNSSSSLITASSAHTLASFEPPPTLSLSHMLPVPPLPLPSPARPPSPTSTIATCSSHVFSHASCPHACCPPPPLPSTHPHPYPHAHMSSSAAAAAAAGVCGMQPKKKESCGKRKVNVQQQGAEVPKVRRACSYCHSKKVSCSCTRPCNRCVELDLVCTDYEPRARPKRPRTRAPGPLPQPSPQQQQPQPLEASYRPEPLTHFLKPSPTTLVMPLGADAPFASYGPLPNPSSAPMHMQMPMQMHFPHPCPPQQQAPMPMAAAVLRSAPSFPPTQPVPPPLYRQCTGPEPFLPPHLQQPVPRLHAMTLGLEALGTQPQQLTPQTQQQLTTQDAVALGDSCPAPSALFRTVSEQNFFTSLHTITRPPPPTPQAGFPLHLGPADSFPTVLDEHEQVFI